MKYINDTKSGEGREGKRGGEEREGGRGVWGRIKKGMLFSVLRPDN